MEEQEKAQKVEELCRQFQNYIAAELHSFEEQEFLDQLMRLITWWPDALLYRLAERLGFAINTRFYDKVNKPRPHQTFALLNTFRDRVYRARQKDQRARGNIRGE